MQWTVPPEADGRVLHNLLQREFKFSRRLLRQLVQTDGITRNNRTMYLKDHVRSGDIIDIMLPPEQSAVNPAAMELDIRYEDDEILIVNKPPGVLSHPTAHEREGSILAGLLDYLSPVGQVPHCVHRLDRDTSGVVMFAKHSHAHHLFDVALREGTIHRSYTALVHLPIPAADSLYQWQTIALPIAGDSNQPSRRVISADGQQAITHFRLLRQIGNIGMVQVSLETGRTHQIRIHLATMGIPILGDRHYDWSYSMLPASTEQQQWKSDYNCLLQVIPRQALHAYRLEWIHPITQEKGEVWAPPPEDFLRVLKAVGAGPSEIEKLLESLQLSPDLPK